MLPVYKSVLESQEVVVVVLVELGVELVAVSMAPRGEQTKRQLAYQVQDGNFHHALVEVGGTVLYDLDCHDFLGLQILAFDDLAKSTLAQHIQNQVPVPRGKVFISLACQLIRAGPDSLVACLLGPQNIVDV